MGGDETQPPAPLPPPWRLGVLQWARLNGRPWDESTTSEVQSNHRERPRLVLFNSWNNNCNCSAAVLIVSSGVGVFFF